MTKQLVWFGAAVMITLLALVVLWQFRIVMVFLVISLTLAAALRPLVDRVSGRSFIVRTGWILLYLLAMVVVGYLLMRTAERVFDEAPMLASALSAQDEWRLSLWLQGGSFQTELVARLPPPSSLFNAITDGREEFVLPTIFGLTLGIIEVVSSALIILLLSIYWSTSQDHFERFWLSWLRPSRRRQVRDIWRKIEFNIGAYLRSQVILSFLAGLLLGIGYWLLGSPYPTLLALAGAVAYQIPVLGVVLAIIPPVLVGLLTSAQHSLLTALYALVVLVTLSVWVEPRLFHRRWDNPILTVVLLLALGDAFGIVGIIVAPPLSVVCQILWNHVISQRYVSEATEQISDLKARQARVWETIRHMDEPPPPVVTSSMDRLTELLNKAEPILQTDLPVQSIERTPDSAP